MLITLCFVALCLMVIYMNVESWPVRILWLVVMAASMWLLSDTPNMRMFGPIGVVVILSVYQSYKNRGLEDE